MGKTTTIRVPVELAQKLLEIARRLDEDFSKKLSDGVAPSCPRCESVSVVKDGHDTKGQQKYACKVCGRKFLEPAFTK